MLKNYSDRTIAIKIANLYIEIPPGWSTDVFADDPDLEEFLRSKYPELNPDYGQSEASKKKSSKKSSE